MKRCPQCNRVESDEALKFCRVDGVTLVSHSSSINQRITASYLAELGEYDQASEASVKQSEKPSAFWLFLNRSLPA